MYYAHRADRPSGVKCSALIVCDFVEELERILPLNHRERESVRQREEVKERVEQEQKEQGDKILITTFCIHPNLCVLCISSKVFVKVEKRLFPVRNKLQKTLNSQHSVATRG